MTNDCLFCWHNADRTMPDILLETTWNYVVHDGYPVNRGHLLIIPKSHFEDWFSIPLTIQHDAIQVANRMKLWLDEEYDPDGYNIGINCGSCAGQTIFHHHLHLIPRYRGDCICPEGGVRGVIPERQSYRHLTDKTIAFEISSQ